MCTRSFLHPKHPGGRFQSLTFHLSTRLYRVSASEPTCVRWKRHENVLLRFIINWIFACVYILSPCTQNTPIVQEIIGARPVSIFCAKRIGFLLKKKKKKKAPWPWRIKNLIDRPGSSVSSALLSTNEHNMEKITIDKEQFYTLKQFVTRPAERHDDQIFAKLMPKICSICINTHMELAEVPPWTRRLQARALRLHERSQSLYRQRYGNIENWRIIFGDVIKRE